MSNLVRHICEFTCSPHQSTFINVTATQINPKNNSESARDGPSTVAFNYRSLFAEVYVDGIDVHITEEYMNGTFNSCKSVQFPSSGQLALDLMCGDWGASRCSPMRWYSFMGDAAGNSFVPFQINYRPHNSSAEVDGFKPMDPRVVPCSESVDVSLFCSMLVVHALLPLFRPTGSNASMFMRRLRLVVPKASSARTGAAEIPHLGTRRLHGRDVLHFPARQLHVRARHGLLLERRSR